MNIHDRSSLLLVPSGYKDGKLYSQVPNSGDGDFTFTRGSNLAATRVGADGLIEKGRENLLTYSNQFNVNWTGSGSWTATSNQSGYDGSNDAWLLADADGTGNSFRRNISNTGVLTFSAYFKAGSIDGVRVRIIASPSNVDTWWNLADSSTEPYAGASGLIGRKKEILTNGWVRLSITFNATSTSTIRLYSDDGSTQDYAIGNFYIQDAQLEAGLAATDYIESGATTGKAGILENQPRFDYSGGASRASLLLEPSRTNLITRSEYFGSWSQLGTMTISDNSAISPEGVQNAASLSNTSGATARLRSGNVTSAANEKYVMSIFAKANGANTFGVRHQTGSKYAIQIDLSDQTYTSSGTWVDGVDFEDYGNGWWRVIFYFTADDITTGTQEVYLDDGESVYLYGWQFEQDATYPTSYIPTYGASVTRSEDATSELALSPSYGSSNTWFFELKRIPDTSLLNQPISIIKNDSTGASNRFTIMSTGNGRLRVLLSDENGTTENLYSPNDSFQQGETIKAAVKITPSGCTLFVDGASAATSSSVGTITGIDAITYFKNVALNQFLVFPTALSDTDCELLTGTTYESFAAMAEALNYTVYE